MSESILGRLSSDQVRPVRILVVGASGGIGRAYCRQIALQFPNAQLIRMARDISNLEALSLNTQDISIDLESDASIEAAVLALPEKSEIDWVFVATGWLHDKNYQPEKSFRSLSSEQLTKSYQINTFGPALLVKNLLARLNPKHPVSIGVLTARVGSISDNRLGGWYSYRSSKAALNMLIKNFAIECSRSKPALVIVGLQPGTTDTDLSAPFQRGMLPENLQTPEYTALKLVEVMAVLTPQDSGQLFDFLGLPFEP